RSLGNGRRPSQGRDLQGFRGSRREGENRGERGRANDGSDDNGERSAGGRRPRAYLLYSRLQDKEADPSHRFVGNTGRSPGATRKNRCRRQPASTALSRFRLPAGGGR